MLLLRKGSGSARGASLVELILALGLFAGMGLIFFSYTVVQAKMEGERADIAVRLLTGRIAGVETKARYGRDALHQLVLTESGGGYYFTENQNSYEFFLYRDRGLGAYFVTGAPALHVSRNGTVGNGVEYVILHRYKEGQKRTVSVNPITGRIVPK